MHYFSFYPRSFLFIIENEETSTCISPYNRKIFLRGFVLSYDYITIDLKKVRLVCLTLCINVLLSFRKFPQILIQTQVVAGSTRIYIYIYFIYFLSGKFFLVHFTYDFSKWSFSFFCLKLWGSKCWLCSYLEQMGAEVGTPGHVHTHVTLDHL